MEQSANFQQIEPKITVQNLEAKAWDRNSVLTPKQ